MESSSGKTRENHLDDLENAFLDEAPLADSTSSVSIPVRQVKEHNNYRALNTEFSEDKDIELKDNLEDSLTSQPLIPQSKTDGLSNMSVKQSTLSYTDNETKQPLLQEGSNVANGDRAGLNMNEIPNFASSVSESAPEYNHPTLTKVQPQHVHLNTNKGASFTFYDEDYETHSHNSPYNNGTLNSEIQETYNQTASRRILFAGIILTLATAGLAVGLISPGRGTRPCENGENATFTGCIITDIQDPTFVNNSSTPTPAPTNPSRPFWTKAKQILLESGVAREGELRDDSILPQYQTLQEKVLNILVSQDEIFTSYLSTEPSPRNQMIQRYVMKLFGVSMNYDTWKNNQGWLVADWSECDWFGVECMKKTLNQTGQIVEVSTVTTLSLNKNGLKGSFPRELTNLTDLENLELWLNEISGTIPDEIGQLTSLKRLWIHETRNMVGTIPSTLGNLVHLESLFLGINNLNGTIPGKIGNLKRLKALALHNNQLTGTIPPGLTTLTDLNKLFLDENKLTGTIPPSIGSLANLEDLRLCGNGLHGSLPPSMTALGSLQVLYLDRNRFSGELIDYIVSGWFKLEKFDAWRNQFTGTVSSQFGRLPYLASINLHDNNFSSSIPENICNIGDLQKLDLSYNLLTGSIPIEISRCTILNQLSLNHNLLNGTIPVSLATGSSSLIKISLEHNNLQGDVPSELSYAPNLSSLNVQQNELLGCIDDTICQNMISICTDCGDYNQCRCCRCCSQCY